MFTVNKKIKYGATLIISTSLLLAGCSSKLDAITEKELTPEKEFINEINDSTPVLEGVDENTLVEISDEQIKALESAESQTAEEANNFNNSSLDLSVELLTNVPKAKDKFESKEEAAQYLSYIFFQYHSSLITAETFYNKLAKYIHNDFKEQLPTIKEDRINMFTVLQGVYKEQLPSVITNYKMTEVVYGESNNEAWFYRKYEFKNGNEIFYRMTMKLQNGAWLLSDDEPTPGYITEISTVNNYEDAFIKND